MKTDFNFFIGIDVSKDKIDVYSTATDKHYEIKNTKREIRHAFFKEFKKLNREENLIVIENTGGYERDCIEVLLKLGYNIHRANNNKVYHITKGRGKKAKTDKIDAKALARYGWLVHNDPDKKAELELYKPLSDNQETLRQLSFFLIKLKKFNAGMKNRRTSPGCDNIQKACEKIIDFMKDEIKNLELELKEKIFEDEEVKKKYELLIQYKGVGKATAMELISLLPELGTISNKAVSSMAGLAPRANDSGKYNGYRTTKGGGRLLIKQALFLASLSAVRFNKTLFEYYSKKISEGKRKMVVMTACMRKMVVHLNAITKKGYMTH